MDPIPLSTDAHSARAAMHPIAARLRAEGVEHFRAPPPEPTTCCGRGCNGCVWESYDAALAFWREDALRALQEGSGGSTSPQPPSPSSRA